ncbi:MAG: GFA family protein [Arenicellales bacterium]|nr:GFA family protein [Arenicellales bacterium]
MKGTCLCGKVNYVTRGDFLGINYCHCKQCRKANGTAFATSAAVREEDFEVVQGHEHLAAYESTPGKKRYFCGRCGSPIYSKREGGSTIYIRLGTLDDDPIVRPEVHIHVASKASWYEIKDNLPQLDAEEGLWF